MPFTMPDLECPKCAGALRAPKKTDAPLLVCSGCSGVWLDAAGLTSAMAGPRQLWKTLAEHGNVTRMPCPACRTETLAEARCGDCDIDWCPSCKGIFFDRGEIEKVRTAQEQRGAGGTLKVVGDAAGFIVGEVIAEAIFAVIVKAVDAL